MKKIFFAFLLAALSIAHERAYAQWYIGTETSYSKQRINFTGNESFGSPYVVDDTGMFQKTVIGMSDEYFFYEIIEGQLGERRSENNNFRDCSGCQITQVISSEVTSLNVGAKYQVINTYLSASIGAARISSQNKEYGTNEEGPGQNHTNEMREYRPRYAIGIGASTKNWHFKISYSRINNIAVSEWTRSSDVTDIAIQIGRRLKI